MGLIKTAAKVAVASSVHGRVQRRQQNRWAEQEATARSAPGGPALAPPGSESATNVMLTQLAQLGELKAAGVLTDAEFQTQKSVILGAS